MGDVRLAEFIAERRMSKTKARQLIAAGVLRAHKLDPSKTNSPYLVSPAAARAFDKAIGRAA